MNESERIRRLWFNYQSSSSEDTWLEQFLHVAVRHLEHIDDDLKADIASQLSRLWKDELKNICTYFEANPDGEPMDRYVFRNRGWQIPYVLEHLVHDDNDLKTTYVDTEEDKDDLNGVATNPQTNGPWWDRDFIAVLMSLFQVRI